MSGGGAGIQGMIQTIVQLKELQQRDAAQQLAEREFGLRVEVSKEDAIQHLQNTIKQADDPSVFQRFVPTLAKSYGVDEDFLHTIISSTPPNIETIKAKKTAAGAAAIPDAVVAASSLAGTSLGGIQRDSMEGTFASAAQQAFLAQNPEDKQAFGRQLVAKLGLGMSGTQAAIDALGATLSPEQKKNAVLIGAGLLPNASEAAQLTTGTQRLILDQLTAQNEQAARVAQLNIMKMEAMGRLGGEKQKQVLEVIKGMEALSVHGTQSSATMTDYGKTLNNATMNSYIEQLRRIAPEIYGPPLMPGQKPDKSVPIPLENLPLDANLGPTGLFPFLLQQATTPQRPNP